MCPDMAPDDKEEQKRDRKNNDWTGAHVASSETHSSLYSRQTRLEHNCYRNQSRRYEKKPIVPHALLSLVAYQSAMLRKAP